MLSAQPVVRNPRVSDTYVPPEEVARMHEAIAKCPNSPWRRLFAKLLRMRRPAIRRARYR